jgi:hypothetical protein
VSAELIKYAEEFMRLGYRIAQENATAEADFSEDIEQPFLYIHWNSAEKELEEAIESMKKATLGQESSQLEFDFDNPVWDE